MKLFQFKSFLLLAILLACIRRREQRFEGFNLKNCFATIYEWGIGDLKQARHPKT